MGRLEAKFVVGSCSATVFANEVGPKEAGRWIRSVAVSRTYKDKEGRFQSVASFPTNEVPKLMVALAKAYAYLTASPAVALTSGAPPSGPSSAEPSTSEGTSLAGEVGAPEEAVDG